MTPEISKEPAGIFASISQGVELGLRSLSGTVLDLAGKTVARYPQLEGVVEAMKIDRLLGPSAYPPEPEVQAKMDAVKAVSASRHAESHRFHLLFLAASTGVLAATAVYAWLQESGILNNADISAFDNQPKPTEATSAEVVEAYTVTATAFEPIVTPFPPTATFVPATETATASPTATPTAAERALDAEHGELEPLKCEGISWEACMGQLADRIKSSADKFTGFEWVRSMYPTKETESGVERDGTEYQRPQAVFRNLTYLGYLDLTYFNERYFNQKVILFGYSGPGGQQSVLPFMALESRSQEMGSVYVQPDLVGYWSEPMTATKFVGIAKPGRRSDVFVSLSFPESSAASFVIDKYTPDVYQDVAPMGIATWILLGDTCWGCAN
ncbi:MAG: hypothetical protein HY602_01320 [Parcubacteria group bacterium]|nr:hypothetical protein [Parcubacteria group bacterium]